MAKVTINKNFDKIFKRVRKKAIPKIAKEIKKAILGAMSKGVSPVKGKGRYKTYSRSYRTAIREGNYSRYGKKLRPVNLKLSGRLYKSIRVKISKKGASVWFVAPYAKYHNEGTSNMPARKMIPIKDEAFSKVITKKLEKILADVVKVEIKK